MSGSPAEFAGHRVESVWLRSLKLVGVRASPGHNHGARVWPPMIQEI